MKRIVSFVLLCEGSSEQPLVQHLQELLVSRGADEATGYADWTHGTVAAKLTMFLEKGAPVNVVFVHRDADSADAGGRVREIDIGVQAAGFTGSYIPVVPIQETEAWLLVDEAEIRSVVGNPNGRMPLNLPSPEHVEDIAHPKEFLADVLATASGKSGGRLAEEKRMFNVRRRILLQRLNVDGNVHKVPAWQRLERAIDDLAASKGWLE